SAAALYRLDAAGKRTLALQLVSKPGLDSSYPVAVAAAGGSVWVLDANTASLTHIDAQQRAVVGTVRLGIERRPLRVAANASAAWVADADGTLVRVDAQSGQPRIFAVAGSLGDVAVAVGQAWVSAGAKAGPNVTQSSTAATVGAVA